jgi:hypothetical protein
VAAGGEACVRADIGKDKIFSHAAALAYYFLLALFRSDSF